MARARITRSIWKIQMVISIASHWLWAPPERRPHERADAPRERAKPTLFSWNFIPAEMQTRAL
jgi:hypothetical protein